MKGERIYMALGNVDDELLERYVERIKRKKKRNIWVKWGALAACLCVVVVGVFALNTQFNRSGSSPITNQGIYKADGTVVASFATKSSSGSYATPKNGTWFCVAEVTDALRKYAGKDVTYFLAFDVFSKFKVLEVKSEEITAELERLSKLGYHVGYAEAWTYQGKGVHVPYTYAAGYFTAEELESFAASEDYGYTFYFAKNGDGTPVSYEQGIVCDFDGGRH